MKNIYGFGEIYKNIISLIYTKIFYKGARLIRRPIYVRGKKFLKYGAGFSTGYNCRIEMFDTEQGEEKKLILGENCKIGDYVHIAVAEKVTIGNNVLLGSKVLISDLNHGIYNDNTYQSSPNIPPDNRPIYSKPVYVGDNVWIGDNVCILQGVNIGKGCIIGANSVVNKDFPDNCIVAGSPAKIIKVYNESKKKWEKFDGNIKNQNIN
ncbi:TPA: acetyltransferase [Clostridium perfringens]|nr:acetyltransferase [Clostridium perfringens]